MLAMSDARRAAIIRRWLAGQNAPMPSRDAFNKSHSAAYALVSYQTLWLKAHYPAEFMAAVMTADMDNTEKVVGLVDECWRMGLKILPPDINSGLYQIGRAHV